MGKCGLTLVAGFLGLGIPAAMHFGYPTKNETLSANGFLIRLLFPSCHQNVGQLLWSEVNGDNPAFFLIESERHQISKSSSFGTVSFLQLEACAHGCVSVHTIPKPNAMFGGTEWISEFGKVAHAAATR